MLITIVIILIILWFLGYAPLSAGISIPNIVLFTINRHPVTLWEILILVVVGYAINILPSPFQTIAMILLVLWILSVLGILAISGLSNILVIVIIIGLVASLIL